MGDAVFLAEFTFDGLNQGSQLWSMTLLPGEMSLVYLSDKSMVV